MPCSLGLRLCGGRRGDLGVLALLSCVCGFGRSPVTADKPLALADPPAAFAAMADGNGGFSGTSPNSAGVQPLMGVCTVCLWAGRVCSLSRDYWGCPGVCFAGKRV